ncbi:helix-turn-helix domain-containing protein [Herbiconiux sp. VKM Ac-2851]|uniref:helix-turn-helix domain-containing protein n=1 Tax=Herbiconiux sp. VKM Ac-2851 TaxID=2739025 RepID=UPI00156681AA|nr:helix-turn-helix domain-containing protein [Herbiconiux sp. VKM Ac-2851]NQX34140.1 helix-turn-helix domain-containing protein [Herbiconiux sp. VKM Ac-2851]
MNLQDVVDELAESLGRSVVVNDLAYRPLAASAQGDEIDRIRTVSLLQRATPQPYQAYLDELQVNTARQPMLIGLEEFGGRERLAVPIRDESGTVAILWLITGDLPPLTAADYAAIEAAGSLLRALLSADGEGAGEGTSRPAVLRRLLSADPATRRRAFSDAVTKRFLERGPGTVVRAVMVGSDRSHVERVAFGRHLGALRSPGFAFLGECGDALIVVGRAGDREALDETVRREAERYGMAVAAIGSAHHDRADDDLQNAVDQACTAAAIVSALPHLGPGADIGELGAWAMLSAVVGDRRQLAIFSPAAHRLCVEGDPLQRTTVETYLDVCGQVRDACELLHIHRTTLYYRLENMPEVVKAALDDGMQRSTLHLCLKLIRFWEATGRA